jgi:hypothetical protein
LDVLFHGFNGFLQCDAHSVYDILERGPPTQDGEGISLVGCRVGGAVSGLAPHRPGHADFPHQVLRGADWLAAAGR